MASAGVEALLALVSAIVLTFGVIAKPDRARCPPTWWLAEGVRRDGNFACYPPVIGGHDDVKTGKQTSVQIPGVLRGRIYCDPSSEPVITFSGQSLRCRLTKPTN